MESSSFWNPESTVRESGIQYPESGIHSMESRIQDCPGFPYMGRENGGKVKNFRVLRRVLAQSPGSSPSDRVLARYIGILA